MSDPQETPDETLNNTAPWPEQDEPQEEDPTPGPLEGNAVFTTTAQSISMLGSMKAKTAPTVPDHLANPSATGYGVPKKNQSPFYMTSNSNYGGRAPNVHTAPSEYHARTNKFTKHLAAAGMPCNRSLNTSMEKSRAHHELDPSLTSHK
eukprot:m.39676 g.39676  ORF g.39676 m.39676 type:complete len:149 (-) comp18260_c0_seq1:229-675(-)